MKPVSWTDEQLVEAVANSISMASVLRILGYKIHPGNYKTVLSHINRLGLSIDHFKGKSHGTSRQQTSKSVSEYLVENSNIGSSALKKKLLAEGLISPCCQICGLNAEWQSKPLVLQLDHINGNSDDNRIENLRLLCPNCHSQTPTFCGRNVTRADVPLCKTCGVEVTKRNSNCMGCSAKAKCAKINATPEELSTAVQASSYRSVAKTFGVSYKTIQKCIKRAGLA